ncbi:MAG: SDR family NAD(P)-dependent oxidoreductase, partial [Rhizomicrobium sp.]
MNRFSLAGKTAVVTGGSRGIGRAIAIGLGEAGADVVFTYREKQDEAEAVAAQIRGAGRRALPIAMDVTDRASVEAAARDARKFGKVSIL